MSSSYVWKLGGAAIAIFMIGVLVVILFDKLWFQVGIGAAIAVVCGGLLFFAWRVDKKEKSKRAGIDELPRI